MPPIENIIIQKITSCLGKEPVMYQKLSGKLSRDHKDVETFQNALATELGGKPKINTEHQLFANINGWNGTRDSADIWFGSYSGYELIIELDATRADQVAKKMQSRFCYCVINKSNLPVIYVAFLYKGTASMNSEECKKYFRMGAAVLHKINPNNILIGYMIGNNLASDEHYIFKSMPPTTINYDVDFVTLKEGYTQFLLEKNIRSVDNYMLPLNQIEQLGKQRGLFVNSLKTSANKLGFIENTIYKKPLSKNQKAYWNLFINFLQQYP